MAKQMIISFPGEGISVRAELLEDAAPLTCKFVWDRLPMEGDGAHGNYSGTIVGLFFDPTESVPEENATTCIQTGDVMYTHYNPGFRHGHPKPVNEIYWAYDRYARPTIPGQWLPATANIFARIIGDPTEFYNVCQRIPREGMKRVEVLRAE